ncbi:MAG: hypothetical protein B7C54_04455 [Acidimicrobiales bacterium mtb01]|nr:MAG: hypothetical protein B7C54_04455 [Acidimicrobiales bacterium mtb01]
MRHDVNTLNLYVWNELVGAESVWSAQIPEVRLSVSAESREGAVARARKSLEAEFPGQVHHLAIHDCLAPA